MTLKSETMRPSAARIVATVAVTSAITGIAFLLTAPIPLIPGAIHWRVLAFVPCIIGVLFGPVTGFLAGGIGNTLWAILGGYFNLATPIFDLVGVGLTGAIPGFAKPNECKTLRGLAKVTVLATVSGLIMVPIVAVGFQLAGVAPFGPAVYLLVLSDMPPIIIGTPLLLRVLYPVLSAKGLQIRF